MLQLAWYCGPYHLPEQGGVLDQDYTTYQHMRTLSNVYDAVTNIKSYKGAQIHNAPVSLLRTIKWLKDNGLY